MQLFEISTIMCPKRLNQCSHQSTSVLNPIQPIVSNEYNVIKTKETIKIKETEKKTKLTEGYCSKISNCVITDVI